MTEKVFSGKGSRITRTSCPRFIRPRSISSALPCSRRLVQVRDLRHAAARARRCRPTVKGFRVHPALRVVHQVIDDAASRRPDLGPAPARLWISATSASAFLRWLSADPIFDRADARFIAAAACFTRSFSSASASRDLVLLALNRAHNLRLRRFNPRQVHGRACSDAISSLSCSSVIVAWALRLIERCHRLGEPPPASPSTAVARRWRRTVAPPRPLSPPSSTVPSTQWSGSARSVR